MPPFGSLTSVVTYNVTIKFIDYLVLAYIFLLQSRYKE